ncbi:MULTISPECIES: hypothetical protein [unclassified Pseudonocardia]|uniref:hypothetical protein n=1 Tax=unclassified Pseudonocardia TaxID=2619320 RepID=UPI000AF46652|nr:MULTISPECIES: hypothetical protein [unclassified Pseudonocardia]
MSSPELSRRVRQQGADIDALYEISERIETKIDTLAGDTAQRFDTLDGDTTRRFDGIERELQQNRELLTQILQRLQG